MSLLDDYAFSLRVTDNVLNFIRFAGVKWAQPWYVTLFPSTFQAKKSTQVELLEKKISEYSILKKEILVKLQDTLSLMELDMSSSSISGEEIMNIRDAILDISQKIIETSEKFSFIQSIYLGDFLNYKEIKKALYDFSNTEVGLFIQIRQELYTIIEQWITYHQSELKLLESYISDNSLTGDSNMSAILQLQSKRLESYIDTIENIFYK